MYCCCVLLQALFCQVPPQNVLTMHDVSNIWRVPLLMQSQDAHSTILSVLGLQHYAQHLDMHQWKVQIADRCVGAAKVFAWSWSCKI
jgi:CTP synthase